MFVTYSGKKRRRKKEELVDFMLCNFLLGDHMRWEGRRSHPSWAMVAESHSSSQIVVYNRGNSSVSHITQPEVTLSCHPRQCDWGGRSSADPMYSTVIPARSGLMVLLLSLWLVFLHKSTWYWLCPKICCSKTQENKALKYRDPAFFMHLLFLQHIWLMWW